MFFKNLPVDLVNRNKTVVVDSIGFGLFINSYYIYSLQ